MILKEFYTKNINNHLILEYGTNGGISMVYSHLKASKQMKTQVIKLCSQCIVTEW